MKSETKICQNCKNQFTIDPEDFDFYEKIKVPPPTWCPQCRMMRRMAWAPDSTTLHSRVCQAPGHSEKFFSYYSERAAMPVYDYQYWRSDAWDPLSYGREYDFKRSFFEQFKAMHDTVPVRNLDIVNSTNCDYCITATDSKNCYLCSGTFGAENCLYSHTILMSKECIDTHLSLFNEQTYQVFAVDKSFQTTYAVYSDELINCDFMYDCRGCGDCLGCVGLRNKRYCIFNKQYSKEEYKKERAKYNLGSYKALLEVKKQFDQLLLNFPKKYAIIRNAPGCTGDNIMNVKNSHFVFQALDNIENCKYALVVGRGAKDSQDFSGSGLKSAALYEAVGVIASYRVYFSRRIFNSQDVYYSRECHNREFLFGCVGLTNKKYCILNKQYTKEEYEKLVPKIIEQMRELPYRSPSGKTYTFGEFFPIEHSPLAYNVSWANEYFTLTKEEVAQRGYAWEDQERGVHRVSIEASKLPDDIVDVPQSITNEIVGCLDAGKCRHNCVKVFRITPTELTFYKKFNIALPRLCPTCRFRDSLKYLTPYRLWNRQCMCQSQEAKDKGRGYVNQGKHFHGIDSCPNTFQTAYAPERLDLLYCESCYHAEIL